MSLFLLLRFPPSPWAKSVPQVGLLLPEARRTQTIFPCKFFLCTAGTPSPRTVHKGLDWAGPSRLADPRVLTKEVACDKCLSHITCAVVSTVKPTPLSWAHPYVTHLLWWPLVSRGHWARNSFLLCCWCRSTRARDSRHICGQFHIWKHFFGAVCFQTGRPRSVSWLKTGWCTTTEDQHSLTPRQCWIKEWLTALLCCC